MLKEETTTATTRTVCPTASSATRELDDLMASLSDFKVSVCAKYIHVFFIVFQFGIKLYVAPKISLCYFTCLDVDLITLLNTVVFIILLYALLFLAE